MYVEFNTLSPQEKQQWLQQVVAPRPICFASTVDAAGNVNLSPFSFFNMFSTQPPILIFSPSRRLRNSTTKHTLQNVLEVPECVVNIVTYNMVQQTSLASCEYPKGINEFEKAGFTPEPATLVSPPMVKESPVKMECRVLEVKSLGESGGAGQLVIAEVLCMHVLDTVLGSDGKPDPRKLDLVARLGGNWYCRVQEQNLFEVPKPNTELGIGIDALPESIRFSRVLTGNHLGMLGNVSAMPEVNPSFEDGQLKNIIGYFSINPAEMEIELHKYAATLLDAGRINEAWQVLLAAEAV